MASHSPQRARRPPPHPIAQGSLNNLRESSRSPSLRSRTMKTHSMPIVPTAMQIFAASNAVQSTPQAQQQPSPTSSITSRRSPPAGVSVQRLLPTPPHPPPANVLDANSDRHVSPPLPPQHSHNPNPHYPRPIQRGPPQFLTKFQNMEQDSWEMTEELLAEIERADLQSQAQVNSANIYPAGYPQNPQNNNSPPKDPAVERVRSMEQSSPTLGDNIQQQRRQQAAQESPKASVRQPNSPITASFSQPASHSPEPRASPYQTSVGASGEHQPSGYAQYTREPPPTLRRASNTATVDNRQPVSLATQTPPLQSITARTPDRSLPVQEELEDEPRATAKNSSTTHEVWEDNNNALHTRHTGSPTPSSDLNLENGYADNHTAGGISNRAVTRDENGPSVQNEDTDHHRYSDRDRDHIEDEGGYTPRSPTADLPEHPPNKYYTSQAVNSRPPQLQPGRRHARNGSTDQLGLRSFDPSVFEGDKNVLVMGSEQGPQFADSRRQQSQVQAQHQVQQHVSSDPYPQAHYHHSHMHPDDIQQYDSSYLQAYLQSPRPEAPIPPTPHSQTAAPSPSPLISGNYNGGKELPPFSPVVPVGSPYPYPFTHVRRNQAYSGHPNRPHMPVTFDTNDLSMMQQQLTKQWQVFAQNQHGHISDSTFSPSSTPFQGASFTPWAYLHTNRTMGRVNDTTSLRSSPSHEPVALPTPPPMIGVKKTNRSAVMRRHRSHRKPPPRVESTQPRETSPELSSSGEETAGEEHFVVPEEGNWVNGAAAPIVNNSDNDEWFDDEDDEEDLLELEYHPNFVSNVEKRRRRWESGWEAVTQALQSLDRQTDATFVLLAAPSHSTKLYTTTSRSVRRQPATTSAVPMKEMRGAFSRIAVQRRNTRSHKSSLLDRFLLPSASSSEGSDGSSESREEDLKRALEAALGSLGALGGIYDQREARWHDEMRRIAEDRERVEMLLRQVLGENRSLQNGAAVRTS